MARRLTLVTLMVVLGLVVGVPSEPVDRDPHAPPERIRGVVWHWPDTSMGRIEYPFHVLYLSEDGEVGRFVRWEDPDHRAVTRLRYRLDPGGELTILPERGEPWRTRFQVREVDESYHYDHRLDLGEDRLGPGRYVGQAPKGAVRPPPTTGAAGRAS